MLTNFQLFAHVYGVTLSMVRQKWKLWIKRSVPLVRTWFWIGLLAQLLGLLAESVVTKADARLVNWSLLGISGMSHVIV
jgi:hypothetical protein